MPPPTRRPRWIVGRGWNQERWGLGPLPDRRRSRRRWSATGRSGWSGSTAMPAGRTARRCARPASPPPARRRAGGRIERTGRNPSGIFVDAAMALVERAVPPPLPLQRDRALARAQEILLSQRPHHRRRHGHERRGLGGDAPRRRRRPAQRPDHLLRLGDRQSARRRRHAADALALRRAAADGRREALSRRRTGLARRLAQGALSRRARPARPAAGHRHRAQESDEPGGDGQFPGRGPRDRRPGQCRCCSTRSTSSPKPMAATGAGGSSMPRSSIPPICRASPATAPSPRCSRPTRPRTG